MEPCNNIVELFGVRVVERMTSRHGYIRSGRSVRTSTGIMTEVVVCFDGLPEPVGAIGDYYNVKQLDKES